MAEKTRYPQIPSKVWWELRGILNRTPRAVIDERYLSTHLAVQEAAAKAYVGELRSVGLLDDDNKPTDLALRWRLDDKYTEAVEEILLRTYPESLRQVAPASEGDRSKVIRWFEHEGLGRGAAGNKAATYMLIGSPAPSEASTKSASTSTTQTSAKAGTKKANDNARSSQLKRTRDQTRDNEPKSGRQPSAEAIPLNVNVQIHISADAGAEQIEAIFSSMRRYLYDQQTD